MKTKTEFTVIPYSLLHLIIITHQCQKAQELFDRRREPLGIEKSPNKVKKCSSFFVFLVDPSITVGNFFDASTMLRILFGFNPSTTL